MQLIVTPSLKTLQERNEEKLKEAKEKLGTKWLLHPVNSIKKLPPKKATSYSTFFA